MHIYIYVYLHVCCKRRRQFLSSKHSGGTRAIEWGSARRRAEVKEKVDEKDAAANRQHWLRQAAVSLTDIRRAALLVDVFGGNENGYGHTVSTTASTSVSTPVDVEACRASFTSEECQPAFPDSSAECGDGAWDFVEDASTAAHFVLSCSTRKVLEEDDTDGGGEPVSCSTAAATNPAVDGQSTIESHVNARDTIIAKAQANISTISSPHPIYAGSEKRGRTSFMKSQPAAVVPGEGGELASGSGGGLREAKRARPSAFALSTIMWEMGGGQEDVGGG